MNIRLIVIGRTVEKYLQSGLDEYCKRLSRFARYTIEVIPDIKGAKSLSQNEIKEHEGAKILEKVGTSDFVVLLDERGKEYSSMGFARFLEDMALRSTKSLTFVIGGAYGFSGGVYNRSNDKISLSKMTFSHQMVRLIFTEQLYRGYSIINNLPYHHE
ncbi:MAG: 23S rRNA (pseudouridine(1915)-N(3))-methyltransferase RlmH [Rikenellaceae bacterium]